MLINARKWHTSLNDPQIDKQALSMWTKGKDDYDKES